MNTENEESYLDFSLSFSIGYLNSFIYHFLYKDIKLNSFKSLYS